MPQKLKKTQIGAEWDKEAKKPMAFGGSSGTRRWLENQLSLLTRQMIIHGYDPQTFKFKIDELPPEPEEDEKPASDAEVSDVIGEDGEVLI